MKKGLDLQGGVHFLLKVDPSFSGTQQTGAKVIESRKHLDGQ